MRLNYKFSNLCGVVYQRGNLVYTRDGNGLFSPVGHRVSFFDLVNNTCYTFPFELPGEITCIALSPNGALLLAIDEAGQAVLCNVLRRVILHHFNFKETVTKASFSPDGQWLVLVMGARLRIWRSPSQEQREFAPLVLYKTILRHAEEIVQVDWSSDSRFLLTASRDMTARVFDLLKDQTDSDYMPLVLAAHKHPLVAAYFAHEDSLILTIGQDGALFLWSFDPVKFELTGDRKGQLHLLSVEEKEREKEEENIKSSAQMTANFATKGSRRAWISSSAFSHEKNLLVVGFDNGLFGLYGLKPYELLYSLGITHAAMSAVAVNSTGEWLAFGSAQLGQLLVWEWRSETFILKQQGHYAPMGCLAYSADGQTIATGSTDGKVKLWASQSGLCFVTFAEHKAAITAVDFTKSGKVVVSASNDGTVRAYDLLRYRNFRTFTAPMPVQFLSLAVDPTGEMVAAGTLDTFEIYLWSMQTGQLLEVIGGHTGPVCALAFDPVGHGLASASWDGTVRLWNVFARNKNTRILQHSADVVALAYRPDGQEVATATLKGEIVLWDVEMTSITGLIEARRDYAEKALSLATIKSLCYSPDGSLLLASGSFPFVALYDTSLRLLLRRFPITLMRRGPMQRQLEEKKRQKDEPSDVPAVRMSPTGRAWAALTDAGLVIFSLDEALLFDPFDLEIDITPERIQQLIHQGEGEEDQHHQRQYLRAFVMSLRLNLPEIIDQVWNAIPHQIVPLLIRDLPSKHLLRTIHFLAGKLSTTCRVELLLIWIGAILGEHAFAIRTQRTPFAAPLRLLLRNLHQLYGDLSKVVNETSLLLEYIQDRTLEPAHEMLVEAEK